MELHIGKVTATAAIVHEIEETEDFQAFCIGCVRRHRSGDWGDVSKEEWLNNNHAARKGGIIRSEYVIPRIFCLGYAEKITVTTNEDRSETEIDFLETDI